MTEAVLAALASTAVPPVTETVRHTGAAGSPLRGSRMWWNTYPPRRQRRAVVLEVASPPARIFTMADGPSGGASGCVVMSCTRIRQPWAGGWPRHRDVPAQADQHATAQLRRQRGGRMVGQPGFRGRTQVQHHPVRNGEQPAVGVEQNVAPVRQAAHDQAHPRSFGGHEFEVAVIARRCHRGAHRRVHVTLGGLRGLERHRDQLGEQRAHPHRTAAGGAQPDQFGVLPEPAARDIQRGQLGLQQNPAGRQRGLIGDHEPDRRPDRPPVSCPQRLFPHPGAGHHDPPEVAAAEPDEEEEEEEEEEEGEGEEEEEGEGEEDELLDEPLDFAFVPEVRVLDAAVL